MAMSANFPQIKLVAIATSLGRPPNEYWDNHPHQHIYQAYKVGQDMSRIFWDIWRDMLIFAVSPQKVLLLTGYTLEVTGANATKIVHDTVIHAV